MKRAIAALGALWDETVGFRFSYSLDIDPEAGPKDSLHYYLYGRALSWGAMRLDPSGIPRLWQRTTGNVYNPAYIASYGLTNLGHYLRAKEGRYLEVFLKQVEWLERNALASQDRGVVWVNDFNYQEGSVRLQGPWVSANVQGFVISALTRGWRVTRRPQILELLRNSTRIFELDVEQGGVRMGTRDGVVYSEKPGIPAPGIMDGFMRSLLGLFDLFIETEDVAVKRLFDEGIEGLKNYLPEWDYRKKWSWYGTYRYLSPPSHHRLNYLMLSVLARLSGESILAEYAASWSNEDLSVSDRMEIYLVHLITKNLCRVKYRTWKQKPLTTPKELKEGASPARAPLDNGRTEERREQVVTLASLDWSIRRIALATSVPQSRVREYLQSPQSQISRSRRAHSSISSFGLRQAADEPYSPANRRNQAIDSGMDLQTETLVEARSRMAIPISEN